MPPRKSPKRNVQWAPDEDKALLRLVKTLGSQNWSDIAAKLQEEVPSAPPRAGKQCRER